LIKRHNNQQILHADKTLLVYNYIRLLSRRTRRC
jgi:hypothetical protein